MVGMKTVEKRNQRGPCAFLNRLPAVVAETEVHGGLVAAGPTVTRRIEHAVDGRGRERRVGGIAGNVRLVHLYAGATQLTHLRRERIGGVERELLEIVVVLVEQRPRQHVGAGNRDLERPARHAGGARAILGQIQRPFSDRAGGDSGGAGGGGGVWFVPKRGRL